MKQPREAEKTIGKANGIPRWALDPFRQFVEYSKQETELLRLARGSILRTSKIGGLAEALYNLEKADRKRAPRGERKKLNEALATARLAEQEAKNGFPLLNAHSLVGIWGALEALAEDVVIAFLVNKPDLMKNERLSRIRVPLGEFESLTREDRMRRVLTLAQRETAGIAGGVATFEQVLELVGLDGEVPDDQRKVLWEAGNIRNVVVHRMSIADQRLVDGCPWLGYSVGDRVVVTDVMKYHLAMLEYCLRIADRVGLAFGVKRSPGEELSQGDDT